MQREGTDVSRKKVISERRRDVDGEALLKETVVHGPELLSRKPFPSVPSAELQCFLCFNHLGTLLRLRRCIL